MMPSRFPPFLAAVCAAFATMASAASESSVVRSPYGVCSHLHGEEFRGLDRSLSLIKAAGMGMVRLDFPWKSIEGADGSWNFDRHDTVVAAAKAAGVTVLPILDYSHPAHPMPHKDPGPWREYVRRVVERYAPDCPVFEVWNEENLGNFCGEPADPANYLVVLKSAFEEIRAAAPQARVAIGGIGNIAPLPYLEGLYRLGGGAYFDIMNLHPYSDMRNNPEGMLDDVLEKHRAQMERFGDGDKPLWITEFGWSTAERKPGFEAGTDDGRFQGGADETLVAYWTARALGIAMAEGVEAVFHFELRSLGKERYDRESHFGLVRDNFVPKPSYLAFATFTAHRPAGSVQKNRAWRFDGRPGKALFFPQWTLPVGGDARITPLRGRDAGMIWTTGFEGVRHLRFGGADIRFFDVFGKELFPPRTDDGGYDVSVTGAPTYFVGGVLEPPASATL